VQQKIGQKPIFLVFDKPGFVIYDQLLLHHKITIMKETLGRPTIIYLDILLPEYSSGERASSNKGFSSTPCSQ